MPKGLGDVYVGPRRRTTSLHHHNQGSGISSTSCTRSTDLCTRHSLSYLSASATAGVPPGGIFSLTSDVATPRTEYSPIRSEVPSHLLCVRVSRRSPASPTADMLTIPPRDTRTPTGTEEYGWIETPIESTKAKVNSWVTQERTTHTYRTTHST